MSFTRIAIALAATAITSPALAADVVEPAPVDPWEFYIGVHGGVVWGDGTWEDVGGNTTDLGGTRGVFGALAGINYRMDSAFFGLEGDIGFATGEPDKLFDVFDACGNGAWCDWNGHVRLRAGMGITDGLDLFVAGGLALADGNGDDDEALFGQSDDDLFVGWTLGVGADYAVNDHFKLRVEYIYDDYGDRNPYPNVPNYNAEWSDNTVRAAAIFEF